MRKRLFICIVLCLLLQFTAFAYNGDTFVYITNTGEKYHTESCGSLWNSKIPITLEEAVNRGYDQCHKCYPPLLDGSADVPSRQAQTFSIDTQKERELQNLQTALDKAERKLDDTQAELEATQDALYDAQEALEKSADDVSGIRAATYLGGTGTVSFALAFLVALIVGKKSRSTLEAEALSAAKDRENLRLSAKKANEKLAQKDAEISDTTKMLRHLRETEWSERTRADRLEQELARAVSGEKQLIEKHDRELAETHAKYQSMLQTLYVETDPLDVCGAPPGVGIDTDGLPYSVNRIIDWGEEYTFFIVPNGKTYHDKCGCNTSERPVNAYEIYHSKEYRPCGRCKPVLPDLSWVDRYHRIKSIKEKLEIP